MKTTQFVLTYCAMLSPSSESSAAVPVPTAISQLERGYLSGSTDILRFQIIFFFFFFYEIPFAIVYNFDLRKSRVTFQLTVRRSVIVQRSRGLRSGRCNGWPWLRSWSWRCRTRCRADGTCAALLPLWNTSTSWTNLPQWSLVNVQL